MSDSDSDEERELRSRQVQKRRDMRSSCGASTSEAQAEAPKKMATIMDSKIRRISSGADAADEALCLSPRTHEVLGQRKRKGSGMAPTDGEPRPRQTVKIPKLDLAPEEACEYHPHAEMKSPVRAQVLPNKGSISSSGKDFISSVQTPKSTATAGSKTGSGSLTPSSARAAAVLSAAAACCAAASMLRGTGSRGEAQATSRSASFKASTTTTAASSSSSVATAATPGKTPAKVGTSVDVMRKAEAAAAAAAAASPRVEPPHPKVQESKKHASTAAEEPTTQPHCAATPESTASSSITSRSVKPQRHHPSPSPACPGSRFASCRRGVVSPPGASMTATLPSRKTSAPEKSPAKAREVVVPVGGDERGPTRREEAVGRSSPLPASRLATPRGCSVHTPASRRPPPSTGRKGRRVFVSDSDTSSDEEEAGDKAGRVGGELKKRGAVAVEERSTKRGRAEVGRCVEESPDAALATRRRLQASKATQGAPTPSSRDNSSLPTTERCSSPTFGRDPPSARPPLSTIQSAVAPDGALERRVGVLEEALCKVMARLEEQAGIVAQVQEEKRAMSLELDECKGKLHRLESAHAAGVGFEVGKMGLEAAPKRRRTPLGMREANSLLL